MDESRLAEGPANADLGRRKGSSHLGGILGPSLMISAFSLLDTVFSFVYQLMVAQRFGARADMDAYLAALTLPAWLVLVFMTPLNFSFVPVFVERMRTGRQPEAWRIASTLLKLLFMGFATFALVAFLFAGELIRAIAPGLPPGTYDTSVWLLRILLPGIVFQSAFSMLANVHYSLRSFATPTLAPMFYVFVNIAVLWIGAPVLGIGSVALGTTVGQAVQALILARILMRGKEELFYFRPRDEGVRQVMRLMLPLVAVGLFRGTDLVEKFFASSLPEGSVSYLGYATRLLNPLNTILATGIVVSVFPHMAEQAATLGREANGQLRRTLSQSICMILFIMLPVAGWLAVLRVPLVTLVLERGSFDHLATHAVASAIVYYLGFWLLAAIANVLIRTLLALKDTGAVAKIELLSTVTLVLGCSLLTGAMGYTGIALSRSLSYLIVVAILVIMVQQKIGSLPWLEKMGSLAKIASSALLSLGATSATWTVIGGSAVHPFLQLLLPGTVGVVTYLVGNWMLRTEELMAIRSLLLAKVIGKLRRRSDPVNAVAVTTAETSRT